MDGFLRGVFISSQHGPLIFLLRRKCSRLEVLVPKMCENVSPFRSGGRAGNSAYEQTNATGVNMLSSKGTRLESWKENGATHRIPDFQVLALRRDIRDLKGIVLVHLLQEKTQREPVTHQTWQENKLLPLKDQQQTLDLNFMILNFSESSLNSW